MTTPDPDMPLPIVDKSGTSDWEASFPNGEPTPDDPVGCAYLWWLALGDPAHYRNALDNLSMKPEVWGDYSQAAASISELSIATAPIVIQEDPEPIMGVKFIEFAGEVGQVFEETVLPDVWIVTVIKPVGSPWFQVWGLSHNYVPTKDDVYGT